MEGKLLPIKAFSLDVYKGEIAKNIIKRNDYPQKVQSDLSLLAGGV